MKEKIFKKGFLNRLLASLTAISIVFMGLPGTTAMADESQWKFVKGITEGPHKMTIYSDGAGTFDQLQYHTSTCPVFTNMGYIDLRQDVWVYNIGHQYAYTKHETSELRCTCSRGGKVQIFVCDLESTAREDHGSGNEGLENCKHCGTALFVHTHSWDYADSGSILTATCKCDAGTNDCVYKDIALGGDGRKVTLTLTASDANYSGTAYNEASLGDTSAWTGAGLAVPTIEYYQGETKLDSAPVNAGSYTAKATVDGKTASVDFTISPNAITPSIADITAVTYDGQAKEPALAVTGDSKTLTAGTDYTVSYSNNTNAGTATATVTLKGNYSGTASKDFTINKADQTISAPTASSKTTASVTLTTLTGNGATKYGYNTTNTAPESWSSSNIISGLSANTTYYFFAKFEGNDNYNPVTSTGAAITAEAHTCSNGVKQDGKVATCTEAGWKDYYKCGSCDKYYEEAACTTGITNLETWKTTGNGKIAALGHEWGYNASGATLTATCNRDASHTATLTLTASSADYSGSGVEPTITYGTTDEQTAWTNAGVKLPGSTGAGAPEVTKIYYNANSSGQKVGSALGSAPINAGKYVVEVNITYGTGVEAGQKASVALSYEIKKAAVPAAPSGLTVTAPQYIGGNNGKITGVYPTMEYSTDNGATWKNVTGNEITGLSTGTVIVRVKETENTNAGTAKEVTIPDGTEKNPAPAAPSGLTVVPASALGASDGKITGVDSSTMQYSLDNGATWINVPGTEITGLEAGKNIQVRLKATDTHLASLPNTLMIYYHTHSWSWKFDKTSHWQECECGAKQNEADHSYVNGKCICGSKKAKPEAVHSDVKEEHSAPEAVRAAEEMFLPLNVVEQDKTGVNSNHFGIVLDKAYNLTAYVTIQGFVSAINKIEKANPKANTVSIYTGKPFTFNKRIVETIQKGGKTIVYYFYHKGHLYSVTVPATVDASKVLEKAGFAGPLYVGKQLGTTKLVK